MNAATIPGTDHPMKVYQNTGKRPPLRSASEARQRRGLLAKIHVAKKQMGLNDGEYEMVLRSFRVASSAELSIRQLEHMVKLLQHYGWKGYRPSVKPRTAEHDEHQAAELRKRVLDEVVDLHNGINRLPGLLRKICGVSALEWARDPEKLERLLAVIAKYKKTESATT